MQPQKAATMEKIEVCIKDKIVFSAPWNSILAETAVEIVKLHEWTVLNLWL